MSNPLLFHDKVQFLNSNFCANMCAAHDKNKYQLNEKFNQ